MASNQMHAERSWPHPTKVLSSLPEYGMDWCVKKISFREMKRQEAENRMAAIRRARRSPQAAAKEQRRASLVGDGAKWRITNFKAVARAIAKWK
jgi:hypothetical protein